MPSASGKQHRLMALVANDPAASKRLGIPQKVGKDFMEADKGRKFARGGEMKESKKMMGKEIAFMKKKGAPKSMIKHEMAEAGMKHGGAAKKYALGGLMGKAMKATTDSVKRSVDQMRQTPAAKPAPPKLPPAKPMSQPPVSGETGNMRLRPRRGFASGGLTSGHKDADGIAKKGKTKGMQVKMMGGGKC